MPPSIVLIRNIVFLIPLFAHLLSESFAHTQFYLYQIIIFLILIAYSLSIVMLVAARIKDTLHVILKSVGSIIYLFYYFRPFF